MNPRPLILAIGLLSLLSGATLLAEVPEDPCEFEGGLEDYVNALLGEQKAKEEAKSTELTGLAEKVSEEGAQEAERRPQGDGAGGGGLDSYKKLFVALQLGSISEEDKALVFNFRPDLLDFGGLGSGALRAVVREAALFDPLVKALDALPDGGGEDSKGSLEEALGDTDDVEYQLRWDFGGNTPSLLASRIATDIFDRSYEGAVQSASQAAATELAGVLQALTAGGGIDEETPLSQVCSLRPGAKAQLEIAKSIASTKLNANLDLLQEDLKRFHFEEVGDLIEGQPRLALDLAYRDRAAAAGPAVTTARLQFQMGDRSFWGWRRWAKRNDRDLDVDGLGDYLYAANSRGKGRSTLVLAAEYSETERYGFPLPEVELHLDLPRAKVLSASLVVGHKLWDKQRSRLDLGAKYEDASGDPQRNNRFVSTLAWTQKLSDELARTMGGSNLVIAAVYANRPEYRGEVDKELSLRVGLKWSIDKNQTAAGGKDGL